MFLNPRFGTNRNLLLVRKAKVFLAPLLKLNTILEQCPKFTMKFIRTYEEGIWGACSRISLTSIETFLDRDRKCFCRPLKNWKPRNRLHNMNVYIHFRLTNNTCDISRTTTYLGTLQKLFENRFVYICMYVKWWRKRLMKIPIFVKCICSSSTKSSNWNQDSRKNESKEEKQVITWAIYSFISEK